VLATLAPVTLVAFLSLPYALGYHPGEASTSLTAANHDAPGRVLHAGPGADPVGGAGAVPQGT
jgi:hypothetical protein